MRRDVRIALREGRLELRGFANLAEFGELQFYFQAAQNGFCPFALNFQRKATFVITVWRAVITFKIFVTLSGGAGTTQLSMTM